MTEQVKWQEPPPVRHRVGTTVWDQRLAPLRNQPGRWALVHTCNNPNSAGPTVAQLRHRLVDANPDERWSFTTRGPDIYARFEGINHE